jgi:hypothetical protein
MALKKNREALAQGEMDLHCHTQVKHHAERGASDLSNDAAVALKGGLGVPKLLCGFDRCNDVIDRAVEFLFGIGSDLADLPHEHFHYRITLGFENLDKLVHSGNSCLIHKLSVSKFLVGTQQ